MSLYHDYLRGVAGELDDARRRVQHQAPPTLHFGPSTPCFQDIPVPYNGKGYQSHNHGDFAGWLRHALRHLHGERHEDDHKHRDFEIHELAIKDIVAAAIKIWMLEAEVNGNHPVFLERHEETAFVNLIIACADKDMVEVKALDSVLKRLSGISALTTPLLLQVLIATAFSHHNNGLVSDLIEWSPPPHRNIFNLRPRNPSSSNTCLWHLWLFSGPTGSKPLDIWERLLRAGWVAPHGEMMEFVYRAKNNAEESASAIYIFDRVLGSEAGLPHSTLSTIDQTVNMGPPAVVAHMLTKLPHQRIKPRPHFLLRDAAKWSRLDPKLGLVPLDDRMLEVLRPMELDTNSIIDPRGKAEGVSPLEDSPLHAATSSANLRAVVWCLRNGARPVKDCYGKYPWEKIKKRETELLGLYKSAGWDVDNDAWLEQCERGSGGNKIHKAINRLLCDS
ncbi:hypothetical protein GGR57DRAFT_68994 [Xylariaceae sp. FL1272]|nr:hypothetical protein GGR57DRAFT_68994 [Xylariaceae sp. FL1272]